MNPKPSFNLFSLKGIGQTVIPRQVSTLVISLAVLSLFVLTACAQVLTSAPGVEGSSPAVALAAVTEKETARDSAFLAANPELLKAHPPAKVPVMTESDVLAANPELKIVRRYTTAIENEGRQSGTYDIEVVRHNNFTDFQTLKAKLAVEENITDPAGAKHVAALRYKFRHGLGIEADIETEATSSIFLAANPELSIARRYAAPALANDVRQSGTYHMEHLRYKYFNGLGIEAEPADRVPVIEPFKSSERLRYKFLNGLGIEAEVAPRSPVAIQPIKGIAASELEAYFLASHPELSSAQRYAALVDWRSNNFPSH